jgi:hypothetical protein
MKDQFDVWRYIGKGQGPLWQARPRYFRAQTPNSDKDPGALPPLRH